MLSILGGISVSEGSPMTINPFSWTLTSFLWVYSFVIIFVIFLSYGMRQATGNAVKANESLSIIELAFLAGGASRLGDVLIYHLVLTEVAAINQWGKISISGSKLPVKIGDSVIELDVQGSFTRQEFQEAIRPILKHIRYKLTDLGYIPNRARMIVFRLIVLPIFISLVVVGAAKLAIEPQSGYEYDIVIVVILGATLAGYTLMFQPMRTREGATIVRSYQESIHGGLNSMGSDELLLIVALSGAVVLAGTPYDAVYSTSKSWEETFNTAAH